MDARLRASPRHSGARKFFLIFSHQSAAGASLSGAAAIIVLDGEGDKNPAS